MATNLNIDDALINRAVELGGHRTKRAAVTQALEDYVDHLEQAKIVDLFGMVDYDPRYDYKQQRRRR